jgi:cell division protein FtsW
MKITRADRSRLADWWFTIDRALLSAILALMLTGLILSLAASPAIALKKGFATYYFVERHMMFLAIGAVVMLTISFLSPIGVRRLALAIFLAMLAALIAVILSGGEINGAKRWLSVSGHSFQPSEFAKPAFIVLIAWFFSEAAVRRDVPALPLGIALWVLLAGLLVLEPDVGQTGLISVTAGVLYLLAGLPLAGALILLCVGSGGLFLAYQHFGHVQSRIDRFFSPLPLENFQVDRAIQSFSEGGLFGRGPGEGTIKSILPDAHTDFILAVVAEEYGVIACLVLVMLFAFIVLRAIIRAVEEPHAADRLAIQGLAIVLGLQALINMSVNVGLIPPKGMTLPFISAGGSSLLALSVTMGMLLALTRRRADAARLKKPRLVATIEEMELNRP